MGDVLRDDGILRHDLEVLRRDDVTVASGGYENVGTRRGLFHRSDLVACHGSLKSIDGIDLGDNDASTVRTKGLGALGWRRVSECRMN